MNEKQLKHILEKHLKWLDNNSDGERANLERANLEGAHLEWAHLEWANLEWANLEGAHLEGAHLERANLEWANLEGAILDFSGFPLWCGAFGLFGDDRLIAQLVAHITRIVIKKPDKRTKAILKALKPYADDFCKYRTDVKKLSEMKKKRGD